MVLTANGEVHTIEEAQVYVHGSNLFVKVQVLEEAPAVLPLGKLFEDREYSYEWVGGQKCRETIEVETLRHQPSTFPRNSPEFTSNFPRRIVRSMAKTKLADWLRACTELKTLPTSGNLIM